MADPIQDERIKHAVETLSSRAETSRWLGSAAAVVGLVAGAVVAGPLAATTVGLGAGLSGAILASLALTRKLRLEKSITAVETATQSLDVKQHSLLGEKLFALKTRQMNVDAIEKIVKEVTT
jgi:hypothetical protein